MIVIVMMMMMRRRIVGTCEDAGAGKEELNGENVNRDEAPKETSAL